jgi:hypothetical protein
MTPEEHPIIPPPELVQQWAHLPADWNTVASLIAQWGADQELEACCQALNDRYDSVSHATGFPGSDMSDWLRAGRRPEPPSLKEQALETLKYPKDLWSQAEVDTIRRALEALPDD